MGHNASSVDLLAGAAGVAAPCLQPGSPAGHAYRRPDARTERNSYADINANANSASYRDLPANQYPGAISNVPPIHYANWHTQPDLYTRAIVDADVVAIQHPNAATDNYVHLYRVKRT